ncbi:MAG: alpha/beta fold hydrolase [Acidimicrobiales bacterium]
MIERTIPIDDVELSVAEAGAGGRPLLVLHGFTGAKEDFSAWLDPLEDAGWHSVAPDHRGHGASSKPVEEDAYSFDTLAGDATQLADALGWGRFSILGHSMGGMVAQYMALAGPDRLDGLVLMDTGYGPIEGLDPELVQRAVSIVRAQGIDALADLLSRRQSPLETPAHQRVLAERPGYAAFGDRNFRATSPALYAAMAPQFAEGEDRLDRLRTLPVGLPVLVMVGEQDAPLVGPSERMAAAIPGGSLAVIPDAGHSPQFENPEAWWSALMHFLDRVTALPSPSD